MEGKSRPILGWIEEACMRLLNNAGGVIADWPGLKLKLSEERQKREAQDSGDGLVEEGRVPTLPELEEAWFGLERKGYVRIEYDRLNIKLILKQDAVPEYEWEDEPVDEGSTNVLNPACDILSCVFILPGVFANSIFGPFPLAFALAMTGSRRKWGVLRIAGAVLGSVLAVAFVYNAVR